MHLKGNFENGYAFAGSNAFRATKISSVKEIFQSLLKEYKESKQSVSVSEIESRSASFTRSPGTGI